MKTALLVIDMQNTFASMVTHSLPNVLRLVAHFREHGQPVLFTQHGHRPDELVPHSKSQLVRKWGIDGSIHYGSHAWEFLPEIAPLVKDSSSPLSPPLPVIAKNTYDAFLGTPTEGAPLEQILKDQHVERVLVCGVMTDCCCDTTGRGSFNRGWETWMVGDACGTANDVQQKRGEAVFAFAYGEVISTDEALRRVE